VKPAPFAYHAPRTVAEATAVLGEVGYDGKVLAGGQSLIPLLSMRLATPGHVVDINGLDDLPGIEVGSTDGDGWVRVGALVRHAHLEHDEAAYAALPLLRQALTHVAHPVIRNRGTTVGSIAHADAAGELPSVLALTGGVAEVAGPSGTREIPAASLFLGPLETSLLPDELITAVRFGRFAAGTGTAFAELARRHGDYAMAGAAAAVTVTGGRVSAARLSFVSATEVPDVLDVTELFTGLEPASADWSTVADAVHDHIDPQDDIHATAAYRGMLAAELARRTLETAAANAVAAHPDPAVDQGGPAT
jgi:carbon-monoxide dehydrogenase medium subunit